MGHPPRRLPPLRLTPLHDSPRPSTAINAVGLITPLEVQHMTSALNSGMAQPRLPEIKPASPTASHKREIIKVHLRNVDRYATVYRDDYDRVVAEIGTAQWFVNTIRRAGGRTDQYIRAKPLGCRNVVMIARIIARAVSRTAVRYRDGDVFNLRSENLNKDLDSGNGGTKRRRRCGAGAAKSRAAHQL